MYFGGEYVVKMDAKGRVVVPAPVREVLQEAADGKPLKLMRHYAEPCLMLTSEEVWQNMMDQVFSYSRLNQSARRLQRIISAAMDCSLDTNNRLLVSSPQRSYAQLDREVIFLGMKNAFEIWDRKTYESWDQASKEQAFVDKDELPALVF